MVHSKLNQKPKQQLAKERISPQSEKFKRERIIP